MQDTDTDSGTEAGTDAGTDAGTGTGSCRALQKGTQHAGTVPPPTSHGMAIYESTWQSVSPPLFPPTRQGCFHLLSPPYLAGTRRRCNGFVNRSSASRAATRHLVNLLPLDMGETGIYQRGI
jgi:hypothetical protein